MAIRWNGLVSFDRGFPIMFTRLYIPQLGVVVYYFLKRFNQTIFTVFLCFSGFFLVLSWLKGNEAWNLLPLLEVLETVRCRKLCESRDQESEEWKWDKTRGPPPPPSWWWSSSLSFIFLSSSSLLSLFYTFYNNHHLHFQHHLHY